MYKEWVTRSRRARRRAATTREERRHRTTSLDARRAADASTVSSPSCTHNCTPSRSPTTTYNSVLSNLTKGRIVSCYPSRRWRQARRKISFLGGEVRSLDRAVFYLPREPWALLAPPFPSTLSFTFPSSVIVRSQTHSAPSLTVFVDLSRVDLSATASL